MSTIGKRILQRRIELNMSQEELALKIGYKDRSSIAKIESGERDIRQRKVIDLANALDTTPQWLMGYDDEDLGSPSVFWEVFYSECQKQGTSPNAVCKAIGLSNAAATGWKNGTLPKADVLVKIADALNVSVDYLLGRTDGEQMFYELKQTVDDMRQKNAPDSEIRSVISNKINQLSDSQLDRLQGYLDALLSE